MENIFMQELQYDGYLDELSETNVQGWLVDVHDNNKIPYVYIKTNLHLYKVLPTNHRLDIQRLFGCNGMRGFSFFLKKVSGIKSLLPEKKEKILGVFFPNGQLILPQIEKKNHIATNICIKYFIHIQKTAGTSLRNTISNVLRNDKVVFIYPDPPGITVEQFDNLPLCQIEKLQLVFGHYYYNQLAILPFLIKYYTILRDPRARIRSQVNHIA